jgi:two-component system cell cycle response regulator DivK
MDRTGVARIVMARESILIVDDNVQNLLLVQVMLLGEGYAVQTAVDAEDALRVLASSSPSLILMDVQLPRMNGLDLTRQIKGDPARRHIIIIALTAYAMTGDKEKALAAGCDGYLSKPLDMDLLLRVVAEPFTRRIPPQR